jgi:ubiquitin C-terminal hydrolase
VKTKVFAEIPEMKGPDIFVAKAFWSHHLRRNRSIIVDLFQGQMKSTLTCPICNHIKIVFDPYTTLPLPIPMKQKVDFYYVPPIPKKEQIF